MAKIGKQWGTIIACWAVALALIITGICLGTIIPSKAADEDFLAVTFDVNGDGVISDDETTYYASLKAASEYVNTLLTTAENPAQIKVLHDATVGGSEGDGLVIGAEISTGNDEYAPVYACLDLNGCWLNVWDDAFFNCAAGELKIVDSQPSRLRYAVPVGERNGYEIYDQVPADAGVTATPVYGGIIAAVNANDSAVNIFYIYASIHGQVTIAGGNYYGTGVLQVADKSTMIFEKGIWHMLLPVEAAGEEFGNKVAAIVVKESGGLTINGGTIYGGIVQISNSDDNYVEFVDLTALAPDSPVRLGENVKMEPIKDESGKVVGYNSTDKTTGEPINPDVPTEDDQPTHDETDAKQSTTDVKTNLIGLIILGVAAAVMVIGVTVIIVVNMKQGKKKQPSGN